MTNFKVCAKIHLFIIISSLLIAIGLAVGTICHFCANGFFNYGGEFKSYDSVSVRYYTAEYKDEDTVKPICEEALKGFSAYETSYYYNDAIRGGEIIYKYSGKTDNAKLQEAVNAINAKFTQDGAMRSVASLHEATVKEGGSKAITFAAIALASAAAFQFIYFVFRYKLRAAFSALLACVHNLGVFVALAAISRVPVGAETIAIGAALVLITMIFTCVLFDRTRKNFSNEKYVKAERLDIIDTSACEVRKLEVFGLSALAVAVVVFGVFAAIAQLWAGALAPFALAIFALIACCYGALFFTPAVHGAIDETCEKVKALQKSKKKDKPGKTEKRANRGDSALEKE